MPAKNHIASAFPVRQSINPLTIPDDQIRWMLAKVPTGKSPMTEGKLRRREETLVQDLEATGDLGLSDPGPA